MTESLRMERFEGRANFGLVGLDLSHLYFCLKLVNLGHKEGLLLHTHSTKIASPVLQVVFCHFS